MRVAVVTPPSNGGIAAAWGGAEAFVLLDPAASFIADDSLRALVAPLLSSPRVGLVYGDSLRGGLRVYRRPYTPGALAAGDIVGPNVVVSRAALEAVGRLDESGRVSPIYELAARISRQFAIIHVPECVIREGPEARECIGDR